MRRAGVGLSRVSLGSASFFVPRVMRPLLKTVSGKRHDGRIVLARVPAPAAALFSS